MMKSFLSKTITLQEVGSPVAATVGGEQAGPGSSSSNDCKNDRLADVQRTEQYTRMRLNSAPSSMGFAGSLTKILTSKDSELQALDELEKKLQLIAEKAKLMQLKTGVQKNVNKETKDGIKVITEAAEVALGKCSTLRDLKAGRLDKTIIPTQNTKRKRDLTTPSPPHQPLKKPAAAGNAEQPEEGWKTVKKKTKKKKNKQIKDINRQTNEDTRQAREDRPRRPPRGTAVLVKPQQGQTYADLLRQVKSKVDPETDNVTIRTYRKTKDGGLLLKLQDREGSQNFQRSLQSAIGQEGTVRTMIPSIPLEIIDLNCVTTAEEVNPQTGDETRHVFGPNRAGQCMAVCELEANTAMKLLARQKIKIGWVNCRIRQRTTVPRCFRCLGYGHTRRSCKGPDRTNCCWKCGRSGHVGKTCTDGRTCFLCTEAKKPGTTHQPGTGSCAVFRAALEECKKRTKT